MKKFIREYLDLIAYAALGIAFVISSFYLLINYYHSVEVSKTLYITENDIYYNNYKQKLDTINDNLKKYINGNNRTNVYNTMYTKLSTCSNVLNSDGMLSKIEVNKQYNVNDIYTLATTFQEKALNNCWAVNLSYLTDEELLPNEFRDVAPFIKNNVATITNRVQGAVDELSNNSSYFMSTSITSSTVRNYLNADYVSIVSSYENFVDIVLYLSEMINGGVSND